MKNKKLLKISLGGISVVCIAGTIIGSVISCSEVSNNTNSQISSSNAVNNAVNDVLLQLNKNHLMMQNLCIYNNAIMSDPNVTASAAWTLNLLDKNLVKDGLKQNDISITFSTFTGSTPYKQINSYNVNPNLNYDGGITYNIYNNNDLIKTFTVYGYLTINGFVNVYNNSLREYFGNLKTPNFVTNWTEQYTFDQLKNNEAYLTNSTTTFFKLLMDQVESNTSLQQEYLAVYYNCWISGPSFISTNGGSGWISGTANNARLNFNVTLHPDSAPSMSFSSLWNATSSQTMPSNFKFLGSTGANTQGSQVVSFWIPLMNNFKTAN